MKKIVLAMVIQLVASRCENTDDMDLCEEGSGDYQFESSGYEPDNSNPKEDRDYIQPDMGSTIDDGTSSSIFNLLRGKKFLAAVVTGSSIGLLLAAFAMCLVLWRARKDANVRRYGYQKGKSESNFA